MTTSVFKIIFTFLSSLVILYAITACSQNRAGTGNTSDDLKGTDKIPEWLMVQVDRALPNDGLNIWIPGDDFQTSPLVKVPRYIGRGYQVDSLETNQLSLEGVLNEQISAQLALAADTDISKLKISVSDFEHETNGVIGSENVQTRFVQFIPVHRALTGARLQNISTEGVSGHGEPDVVGDPLIDVAQIDVPQFRTQPVWFTFKIPATAEPGSYQGTIEIQSDKYETFTFNVTLNVHNTVLPNPVDFSFNLDMWMNPFAVADFHNVEYWSEEHWDLLVPYFEDLTQIGQKKILTTIVEKPWKVSWLHGEYREQTETEFESMIEWRLQPDSQWEFDYTIFDRFVETSLEYENGPTIVAYSMLVFRGDQRITYFDVEQNELVEEYIDIMDDRYEEIWTVFLENFSQHLKEKGWFDQIHLGFDERPARLSNRAFSIIENAAPEFLDKIYISGGTITLEAADLNIEITRLDEEGVQEGIDARSEQELPTRFYQTCCSGAHPNRFTFSPSVELQLIPWIALKYNLDGYADWAYNSWPHDIFNYPVFNFTQGDEYYVYPGEDGPISSIRWELMKEGIEDFELVKVLEKNGVLNQEQLNEAIELATRNTDSGEKDPNDFVKARQILIQAQN